MIQNTTILEKLKDKTGDDQILRDFILCLLENETEGKNYRKVYNSAISDALKKLKETSK